MFSVPAHLSAVLVLFLLLLLLLLLIPLELDLDAGDGPRGGRGRAAPRAPQGLASVSLRLCARPSGACWCLDAQSVSCTLKPDPIDGRVDQTDSAVSLDRGVSCYQGSGYKGPGGQHSQPFRSNRLNLEKQRNER